MRSVRDTPTPRSTLARTRSRVRPRSAVAALAVGLGLAVTAPAAHAATNPIGHRHADRATATTSDQANAPKSLYPTVDAARVQQQSVGSNATNLLYRGGSVVTGKPRVYLVFWGSQWGRGSGETGFANDPSGVAPQLVKLFKGIGTRVSDGRPQTVDRYEQFSNTNQWYCQGASVGSDGNDSKTGCAGRPAADHVGYPTDGALAGIYNDTTRAAPVGATTADLSAEADRAAAYFGNLTGDAQYVLVSPHKTHPDRFPTAGWCAWHSFSASVKRVAYTNLPYIPDAGGSCGTGFVNGFSGGLDGLTMVAAHEYSETVTDPFLEGWWDRSGQENADKCAWIHRTPDLRANAQNVKLSTGTFALQSNWVNSAVQGSSRGACRINGT